MIIVNPGAYNTGFNERFMRQKYAWMGEGSVYRERMGYVRKQEERVMKRELSSTGSIARQVVKAVEARWPKRRYVAPKWEWLLLPLGRRFG